MTGTIYLYCFAIYLLVAFAWQFIAFKDYEDGKTVCSERTILKRLLVIWLWPIVLPVGFVLYGVLFLMMAFWCGLMFLFVNFPTFRDEYETE